MEQQQNEKASGWVSWIRERIAEAMGRQAREQEQASPSQRMPVPTWEYADMRRQRAMESRPWEQADRGGWAAELGSAQAREAARLMEREAQQALPQEKVRERTRDRGRDR